MDVTALQQKVKASDIAPEKLAGNTNLTDSQKVAEASRQFEAILLRQILSESQKTVISSKYADNSFSSGIYKDMVTTQLADSISKSGTFGLAQTFEQQLTARVHTHEAGASAATSSLPTTQASAPADRPSSSNHGHSARGTRVHQPTHS